MDTTKILSQDICCPAQNACRMHGRPANSTVYSSVCVQNVYQTGWRSVVVNLLATDFFQILAHSVFKM